MGDDFALYGMFAAGALALFALIIIAGVILRIIRAPRGQRLRHAFGPLMGAGEKYQELHTGQKGLQDSVIETIQEQEQTGAKRETGEGESEGEGEGDEPRPGEGDSSNAGKGEKPDSSDR